MFWIFCTLPLPTLCQRQRQSSDQLVFGSLDRTLPLEWETRVDPAWEEGNHWLPTNLDVTDLEPSSDWSSSAFAESVRHSASWQAQIRTGPPLIEKMEKIKNGEVVVKVEPNAFCSYELRPNDFTPRLNEQLECEMLDKSSKILPTYDPCPEGSIQDGRYCVGHMASDYETQCPSYFLDNGAGKCALALWYPQQRKLCPPDFTLYMLEEGRHMCKRTIHVKPEVFSRAECPECAPMVREVVCPEGFRLEKKRHLCKRTVRSEPGPKPCEKGWKLNERVKNQERVCYKYLEKPSKLTCPKRKRDSFAGPAINQKIRFKQLRAKHNFGGKRKPCVTNKSYGTNPRCPAGYRLRGFSAKTVWCYKLKIYEPKFSCKYLEGFVFDPETRSATFPKGACVAPIDTNLWAPAPPGDTKQDRHASKRLALKAGPVDLVRGQVESFKKGVTKATPQKEPFSLSTDHSFLGDLYKHDPNGKWSHPFSSRPLNTLH